MIAKAFVDTNVLVYAYDRAAGARHERAAELIEELWDSGLGVVSTQVLQEFYVNVRRKAGAPVSREEARTLVSDYLLWEPVVNDASSIVDAIDLGDSHQLSFWDALIVVAAQRAGAAVLYTEDLNDGQQFGTVTINNPFLDA